MKNCTALLLIFLLLLSAFLPSCTRPSDFSATIVVTHDDKDAPPKSNQPENGSPPADASDENPSDEGSKETLAEADLPSENSDKSDSAEQAAPQKEPEKNENSTAEPPQSTELTDDIPSGAENDAHPAPEPVEPSADADPKPDIAATAAPIINACHNTEPDLISVGGKCERDAEITLVSARETVTVRAYGEYFLAQIRIPVQSGDTTLEITARADGKAPSNALIRTVRYMADEYVYNDEWHIRIGGDSRGFAQFSFADFEGTNLLSEKQLESFKSRIRAKTERLNEEVPGCELIYMIVPNALTVYAEQAPSELTAAVGKTKLDQVIEAINFTDATALDLRPILREHRNDELQPYLNTDSHWSEYGAYLGLSVLCDYISADYPQAKIRPLEQYGFENRLVQGGDVIYYLNMDNSEQLESAPFFNPLFKLPITADKYLSDGTLRMDFDATSSRIRISTGNEALPDCVVFRDSYGIAMYEILPDRFNNTAYYYTWGYNFDMNYIKDNSPDYVIYIIAERNVDSIIK